MGDFILCYITMGVVTTSILFLIPSKHKNTVDEYVVGVLSCLAIWPLVLVLLILCLIAKIFIKEN